MQCSTVPSKIFSYALLLFDLFFYPIIQIGLDGMVVHPPQATKKEHGILILNVPCSFCPLLQHFFYIEVNPSFQRPPESTAYIYNRYSGQVQSILCTPCHPMCRQTPYSSKIVVVTHFTVFFKELFKIVHRVFPLYPSHAVHIRNRRKLPASLSFLLRHLYILNSLNS